MSESNMQRVINIGSEILKIMGMDSTSPANARSEIHIRWMIRRDMPSILNIEEKSFEFPWSEETFIHYLRQRNCIGMVAQMKEEVVGYMIYELHSQRLQLLNFASSPSTRNIGVGSAMVDKLISKLSFDRRNRIVVEVRETNLKAQMFFKSRGFRAIGILRDHYLDNVEEDAYIFQYRYEKTEF